MVYRLKVDSKSSQANQINWPMRWTKWANAHWAELSKLYPHFALIWKETLFVCPMERSLEIEKDAKHLFRNVWRRFLKIALNKLPIEAQKMLVKEYILHQLQPYFSNQIKNVRQLFNFGNNISSPKCRPVYGWLPDRQEGSNNRTAVYCHP